MSISSTRRRLWVGRCALALCGPLLAVLALEAACRLLSLGYPTSFLIPATMDGHAVWSSNPFFGYRFFEPLMARNPAPLRVDRRKEPDVTRIVVLGESAAMGDPVLEFGLARVLDKQLNRPGEPRRFEVINAAMTAINSHVIRDIARELARHEADVLLVYMGNNEVVGPYGPGTVLTARGRWPAALTPLRVRLTRLRLAGLVQSVRRGRSEPTSADTWEGMAMFTDQRLGADAPSLQTLYTQFQRNLTAIVKAGRRNGARVLLCTVAVNLRDCAPFGSDVGGSLDPDTRRTWETLFASGIAAHERGQWELAESLYADALNLDDTYAELCYRYAQVLDAQARQEAALPFFLRARDRDTQRFRADSALNRIIREVAANEAAPLVDMEAALGPLPGAEAFVDHVHFTIDGVEQAGHAIAGALAEWYAVPSLPDTDTLRERLFFTPWGERRQAAVMLQRRERPPFNTQWGNAEQRNRMREIAETATRRIERLALDEVEVQYLHLRRAYPHDPTYTELWGHILANSGAWDQAAEVLGQAMGGRRGHSDMLNLAVLAQCQAGRPDAAAQLLLNTGPPYGYYLMDSLLHLAGTLEQAGRPDLAEAVANRVLEHAPRFPGREVVERWMRRHNVPLTRTPRPTHHKGRANPQGEPGISWHVTARQDASPYPPKVGRTLPPPLGS